MLYCSECGKQIPASSKFCPYCGHPVEIKGDAPVPEQPASPEVIREFSLDDVSDSAYKLMEPGTVFSGYTVVRLLNKDPEGIKYIAEKNGSQYVLKLFFKYKFSNLDTIIGLQTRLKLLNTLKTAHTAKVVEINQNHDPAYMVAEYVSGDSVARLKAENPDRLGEETVRKIAVQLVETAVAVRKQGLSLSELTLSGIMVDSEDKITVLSSGIKYEEADEREEVFNIGVILAQMLSRNVLYKVIYSADRLQEQKFSYIPGVSVSLNRVLAECLHRNMLQRSSSLESLLKSLRHLPSLATDQIHAGQAITADLATIAEPEALVPKAHIETRFFVIIGLVLIGIILAATVFLPRIIRSGVLGEDLTEMLSGTESPPPVVAGDATPGDRPEERSGREQKPASPAQGYSSQTPGSATRSQYTPPPQTKAASGIPANFTYVPSGTLGFNTGKENPRDNVRVDGFYISKFETTQQEWDTYMMAAAVSHRGDKLPVDNVSWIDIILYCNRRSEKEGLTPCYMIGGGTRPSVTCSFSANGYRLPTEAEWEMAAKAGHLTTYSGSDDLGEVARYRDNSQGKYSEGGRMNANAFGIYDMTGNVAEWCWDWFDAKYPGNLDTIANPTGPASGTYRVIRGGSVRFGEGTNLQLLYRDKGDPHKAYQYVGFRLVRKR